jgi:uncharacterized protein (TIGR02328 family)
MSEMVSRGYNVDQHWYNHNYRGKQCEPWSLSKIDCEKYPEHDDDYLRECIENLRKKNVIL